MVGWRLTTVAGASLTGTPGPEAPQRGQHRVGGGTRPWPPSSEPQGSTGPDRGWGGIIPEHVARGREHAGAMSLTEALGVVGPRKAEGDAVIGTQLVPQCRCEQWVVALEKWLMGISRKGLTRPAGAEVKRGCPWSRKRGRLTGRQMKKKLERRQFPRARAREGRAPPRRGSGSQLQIEWTKAPPSAKPAGPPPSTGREGGRWPPGPQVVAVREIRPEHPDVEASQIGGVVAETELGTGPPEATRNARRTSLLAVGGPGKDGRSPPSASSGALASGPGGGREPAAVNAGTARPAPRDVDWNSSITGLARKPGQRPARGRRWAKSAFTSRAVGASTCGSMRFANRDSWTSGETRGGGGGQR